MAEGTRGGFGRGRGDRGRRGPRRGPKKDEEKEWCVDNPSVYMESTKVN
jgi:hypothetical protein